MAQDAGQSGPVRSTTGDTAGSQPGEPAPAHGSRDAGPILAAQGVPPAAPRGAYHGGQGPAALAPASPTTEGAPNWGPTMLTIGPQMAAGLSYLFWWISGLVIFFNERHNRYVRFHAIQAVLLTAALTVLSVLAYVASNLLFDVYANTHQRVFQTLGQGIALLTFFVVVMLWLAPMIAAWSGAYLRLPILGDYAERYAAPAESSDEPAPR